MTRVETGSRLHFGLLNSRGACPGLRHFGGCGLMIQEPAVVVQVETAEEWIATGPHAERALKMAQQTADSLKVERCFRIEVLTSPPEHVGLGLGTQLALAISTAVAQELQLEKSTQELAWATGRGRRSGVGLYGFQHGGFLVDGGHSPPNRFAPLIFRTDFPEEWPIVLMRMKLPANWHGSREAKAFERIESEQLARVTAEMCRELILAMIPALHDPPHNFSCFAESLWKYNRLAGEAFQEEQGGLYSAPEVESLVNLIRTKVDYSPGQSSWGPTVYTICPSLPAARQLADDLKNRSDVELIITRARNHGAVVTQREVGSRQQG